MSESYSPGPGVANEPPYTTAFLSQRDVGLEVPINFVNAPGVSFSAACFPHSKFEDDLSGDCLSNLLAVGFRRFEIDLYWDDGRQVWSFCPVAIPVTVPDTAPESIATLSFGPSTSSPVIPVAATGSSSSVDSPSSLASSTSQIAARQVPSNSDSNSTSTSASIGILTSGKPLGQSSPSIATVPDTSNEPLVSIGPYTCTTTINLSTFTSQFLNYFQVTGTTISANLLYVIINIHAAASKATPLLPAPQPTSPPQPMNLLGTLFSANLSAFLYTPSNLRSDRGDLNGSWYRVEERYRPTLDYFNTSKNKYGVVSTDDGWPSESYIVLAQNTGKRLLLGYGTVDPQMAGYNFSGDESTIFPSGYIQTPQYAVANSSGRLTGGCLFSNSTYNVARVNSSWASLAILPGFDYPTAPNSDLYPFLNLTLNVTNCGITPILNVTLLNATAREDFRPYQNYTHSTIWSWAPGEPKHYTSDSQTTSESLFSCATANIDLHGRWIVSDCSSKYFAACRAKNQPYNWTITSYQISYSFAKQACDDSYEFAVPRTSLENSYLHQAMKDSRRDYDGHGAWVDFNSLNYQGCWTSGGPNATCPYLENTTQIDDLQKRFILIPTVAAIIVLILTVLTMSVKVAGNRSTRKRSKKRADEQVLYEGVPS